MKIIYSVILLFGLLYSETIWAKYINNCTSEEIKTVRLHKNGWEISQPIINLRSTEQLLFSFDDLSGSAENYNYTIVHCSPDWEESGLNTTEYLDGFPKNQLLNYKYSYGGTYRYVHYELLLPNRDVSFKISGNYALIVTKDNDDTPIIIRQFYVSGNQIKISPNIRFSRNPNLADSHQELNFSIFYPGFKINNPREEVVTVIQQNGRTDNRLNDLKPQFIRPDELVYNYTIETSFEANNEFRWIDTRSIRYLNETIRSIDFYDPFYHVTVNPDFPRVNNGYYFRQDFNGNYVVNVKEGINNQLEADYVFVHFTVPLDAPFINETLNIYGDGFGWEPTVKNQFEYNFLNHCYEYTALLKQGVYDYMLGVKSPRNLKVDFSRFEGNYRITENNYIIYVYYKGLTDNYYQLIGIEFCNSIHNKNNL